MQDALNPTPLSQEIAAPRSVDFRLFLQQELVRRCRENRNYSLRAFARHLSLEPSFLSKLLRGERNFTLDMFRKLAERLMLEPEEFRSFAEVIEKRTPKRGIKSQPSLHELSADQFQVIADWYHYALIELLEIKSFQNDTRWIARALDITTAEASAALERLERVGILERTETGWKNATGNNTTTGNSFTTVAFRKLQKSVLEKAIVALENLPLDKRDQSSITMAVDSRKLPEAKKRIQKFRRELMQFLQTEGEPDQVYHLSVSLYPVTNLTGHESIESTETNQKRENA
jgi:uncharacterized protein (TIGR02147 family)